jgi:hypothetical protein
MRLHASQTALGIPDVSAQAIPERDARFRFHRPESNSTPKGLASLYRRCRIQIRRTIGVQFVKGTKMTDRVLFWTVILWVCAILFEA